MLVTVLAALPGRLIPAIILAVGLQACDPDSTELAAGTSSGGQERSETMSPSIEVRNLGSPGAFEVVNSGEAIDLAWEVGVEKSLDAEWRPVEVEQFELVEKCGEPKDSPCRTLEEGAAIRPVPWTGYSCTSQCNEACRANVYYGPGRFRFVVWNCSKRLRFEGPPFELPADPPSPD